jgi:hypothetical protein
MGVCDCCGHLTDRPEYHPGPYGTVVLCPLCAGLGAVAHLTIAPGPEGADHGHGGTGTVRR